MQTRLRDLREDKDISQEEAAKTFNMHVNTYARYERGDREISLKDTALIADYYKVTIDYIANRSNKKEIKAEAKAEDNNITMLWNKLKAEEKEALLVIINSLLS